MLRGGTLFLLSEKLSLVFVYSVYLRKLKSAEDLLRDSVAVFCNKSNREGMSSSSTISFDLKRSTSLFAQSKSFLSCQFSQIMVLVIEASVNYPPSGDYIATFPPPRSLLEEGQASAYYILRSLNFYMMCLSVLQTLAQSCSTSLYICSLI